MGVHLSEEGRGEMDSDRGMNSGASGFANWVRMARRAASAGVQCSCRATSPSFFFSRTGRRTHTTSLAGFRFMGQQVSRCITMHQVRASWPFPSGGTSRRPDSARCFVAVAGRPLKALGKLLRPYPMLAPPKTLRASCAAASLKAFSSSPTPGRQGRKVPSRSGRTRSRSWSPENGTASERTSWIFSGWGWGGIARTRRMISS